MVMQAIADLGKEVLVPSVLFEAVDGIDDKEDHDFLETLLVADPLLGMGILIGELIKVPSS